MAKARRISAGKALFNSIVNGYNVHFHPREVKTSTIARLNSQPWELKLQSQRNEMFPANKMLTARLSARSLKRRMSTSLMQVTPKHGTKAQPEGYWERLSNSLPGFARAVQAVLNKVLHGGPKANTCGLFEPDVTYSLMPVKDLLQLLNHCEGLFGAESTLVKAQAPCKIFGDIHGQFNDLMSFFSLYGSPSHRNGDINLAQYVFIGDFVDRGMFGLEVITVLLCLKARYPDRIILIRGNHETEALNEVYGFMDECLERLQTAKRQDNLDIFNGFQRVFALLPLGALIEGKVLCVHGGIGEHVKTLDDIESIARPVDDPTEKLVGGVDYKTILTKEEKIIVDLLWSDPRDKVAEFGRVSVRGAGSYFDTDDVYDFCKRTGVQLIIRAHECVPNGYALWARGRCITLFSAPDYCGRHRNAGAMIELSRSLGIHVKTVQSKSVGSAWANTVDATPPPSDTEMEHRDLANSDSVDSESEEENEVVSFEEHMLDPTSTKDSPIHMLNTEDIMLVLRSRNAAKYGIGVTTRLGVVFSVDPVRSLVVIKADANADDKGAKNKVRWFKAPDVDTYKHDEMLLNGAAVVVAIDTTQKYVFWRYLDQSAAAAGTPATPTAAGKAANLGTTT